MMQYFSQFGELTGVNMLYPSRCAFVNYRDPESAKLALLARDVRWIHYPLVLNLLLKERFDRMLVFFC